MCRFPSNDLLVLLVEVRNVLKVFRVLCKESALLQDLDDIRQVFFASEILDLVEERVAWDAVEGVLGPGLDVVGEIDLSLVVDLFGRHGEREVGGRGFFHSVHLL